MDHRRVKTLERFRAMLNDIAERDGIRRFNKLSEMTGIAANTFTNIKLNRVKEVDVDTFWKINNAFGKRYNVGWFIGDSPYMLVSDMKMGEMPHRLDFESLAKKQRIIDRAQEIQLAVLGHVVKDPEIKEGMAADDDPKPYLPTWADTLLTILSKQIAENEVLHQELKEAIQLMKHYFEIQEQTT